MSNDIRLVDYIKSKYGVTDELLLEFIGKTVDKLKKERDNHRDSIRNLQEENKILLRDVKYRWLREKMATDRVIHITNKDTGKTKFTFNGFTGILDMEVSSTFSNRFHFSCLMLAKAIIDHDKFEPTEYKGTAHFDLKGNFWVSLKSLDGLDVQKIEINTGIIPEDIEKEYFNN